jgi:protein-disulfide isomerase
LLCLIVTAALAELLSPSLAFPLYLLTTPQALARTQPYDAPLDCPDIFSCSKRLSTVLSTFLILHIDVLRPASTTANLWYSGLDFRTLFDAAALEEFVNRRSLFALALTATLVVAGSVLLAAPATGNKTKPPAAPTAAPQTIAVNGVADIDPAKAFGSKNAPVTMEIFSDFQCPACKQLFTTTNQRIMENYVDAGKVYLIHRDFPLPMHAYSRIAANYARAACHMGKCEPVEQALFQNQEQWEASGDVKGTVASVLNATEMKKVQALVDGKTLEPLIERDKQIGQGYSINQTPTSIIHSKTGQSFPVVGFVSYDVLKTFLDQLVAQK